MIRYYIRDLAAGWPDDGGINASGGAVFTEVTARFAGATLNNIAGVADPWGDVFHVENHFGSRHDAGYRRFRTTSAGGVNKNGLAVGTAYPETEDLAGRPEVAILTNGVGLGGRLDPLPGFGTSVGVDINDAGTVLGMSVSPDTQFAAATVWTGGVPARIDDALPNVASSHPTAINNPGAVVGFYIPNTGGTRPWLRLANGQVRTDIGPTAVGVFPADLNDHGLVVGGTNDFHAWSWKAGQGSVVLPGVNNTSEANAFGVNNLGAICGESGGKAVVWDPAQSAGAVDLNTAVTAMDNERLIRAVRISDSGCILCAGTSAQGELRSYLLIPYLASATVPRICAAPDRIVLGAEPANRVFNVNLPCLGVGQVPQGKISVSKLCQLVVGGTSALNCPGCMRLNDAPCGDGWGISVEGVPDGVRVTLFANDRKVAVLAAGKPRAKEKPFKSKQGKGVLEAVFAPSGKYEYSLVFQGPKSMKPSVVFPVRLTVFRESSKPSPKTPRASSSKRTPVAKGRKKAR